MGKRETFNKILCGVTAGVIGLYSLGFFLVDMATKDYLKNKKYQDEVASTLDANMHIMETFSPYRNLKFKELVRLKPNDSKKIYVGLADNVSDRTKQNIEKTLNEINNVFTNINDNYNFAICSMEEYLQYKRQNQTVLKFEYKAVDNKNLIGFASDCKTVSPFFDVMPFVEKNCYIKNATIYLNSTVFDKLTDISQLYTIKHEIMHTLGFDDIYEEQKYDDETSIMNVGITGLSTHLSPNDIKMLYVAYGNKHINEDGSLNQEKLESVKKYIDDYENKFYKYLMNTIESEVDVDFETFKKDELSDISFEKYGATVDLKDGKFDYTISDYQKNGKIIFGDNYAIIPDIKINNNNDFLIIAKVDGEFKCFNLNIYHKCASTTFDPTTLELDLQLD